MAPTAPCGAQHSMVMRTTRASRRRAFLAVAAAGALAFAACGGDESADSVATSPETAAPPSEVAAEPAGEVSDDGGDDGAPASSRYDDGGLDLVGVEVGAPSNVETNPFPDLVVDDLNRDKQVNLRNAIPGERPVLLWFWAPH